MGLKINPRNEKTSALASTPVVRRARRLATTDPSGAPIRGKVALNGLGADDDHCRAE